jgi:hypothetical protein
VVLALLSACFVAGAADAQTNAPASSGGAPGGVTLRGRLVDAYPGVTPQPDAVIFRRVDGPPVMTSGRVAVRADRTFVIQNVAPGIYDLQAGFSYDVVTVTVGKADVSGIEIKVSGQVALFPDVRMDDGSPIPEGGLWRLQVAPRQSLAIPLGGRVALVAPRGKRWIFISAPEGVFIRSAVVNGVDIRTSPVDFVPDVLPPTIHVVLTREKPAAPPTGVVVGATGLPGLEVELINVTGFTRSTFVGTATTDTNGAFRFEGLTPGLYRINIPPVERVVDSLEVGAGTTSVDIPIPEGTRVVGGGPIQIYDGEKRMVLARRARLTILAQREGTTTRVPIEEFVGFWGALAPGAYRLMLEGLEPGFSIRSFTAGSINLLEQPFVVPMDRPAETIRLDLNYSSPE